ncbi:proline dehydrogenase family protein [Pedobacter mucosus]|uniref:proline dehydrogenase family protein n=1 Tax=Pedobacter mucosus TaxID=2895286 RepID=UPI001EE4407B|nr:proline dehydrogenase family protein [Pedobacter mucosus]UKT65904.1 proline dehydrogenase family protein [Pedobacter mucosus]
MDLSTNKQPNFDNTEVAFRQKTNAELKKAFWLFKMIGNNFLTKVGPAITNFFLNIGLPVQGAIKVTIFQQFCGGETISECDHTIDQLNKGRVGTILDYSVEGEDEESIFDDTCTEIISTILRADGDSKIPITVFKITGIGRFALLEKLDAKQNLSQDEKAEFEKVKLRCELICKTAFDKKVPVMIDAEETWIQNTIDELALEMMQKFNKERIIVYNTYQMYRKDKLADLKADHLIAKAAGFILGVKIVRGAYMEKERKRALENGYPSPIQPDKETTDKDYNAALRYCVDYVEEIAIVAGTHNEDSCRLLTYLLDEKKIIHNHTHVYFSQLLGMSDNLSFNLADADYNVAKYVPYGPIKSVMPYLFRRAQENTSVKGQTGRELGLIERELKRRAL